MGEKVNRGYIYVWARTEVLHLVWEGLCIRITQPICLSIL